MQLARITSIFIFLIFQNFPVKLSAQSKVKGSSFVSIGFGSSGFIRYDLKTGKYDILQGGKPLLKNGTVQAKENGKELSANNYPGASFSKIAIHDKFGKGFKSTVSFSATGLPTLKQIFYTYPNRDYFLVELVLEGKNVESNYLSPLLGSFSDFGKEQRSLFVPFDNDAFVRYDAKKFEDKLVITSAEVAAVYDQLSGKGIIVGSVEHEVWKSGITSTKGEVDNGLKAFSGYSEFEVTRDKHSHGFIKGNQVSSAKFFVGYFQDWRTGLEEYGKANRIAEPPFVFNWNRETPVGWNSWGVLQEHINYQNTTQVVNFFADSIPGFRNGKDFYIDLDSYWDNMVKGGYEGDYTELKKFADYCKSKGLQPGIYWAPFTDWGDKNRPDRRAEGGTYTFGNLWTKVNGGYHDFDGARAIDPTHPGTQARIKLVISRLKECGFRMIKIDFLGHAAIEADSFYDKKVSTGMQAYKSGMEFLIKELDNKMLVYAAISPSLASGRYTHMRRIACDAWKTIKDTEYTLNSVSYGWWQSYLYNYLDADHVVFANETIGENRARVLSAVVTGTLISGDDFSKSGIWSERAKQFLQNKDLLKLVAEGKGFRPLKGNTGTSSCDVFWKKKDGFCYLAIFNFDAEAQQKTIDLKYAGLLESKVYSSSDILTGKAFAISAKAPVLVSSKDALLLKFKL